MFNQVAVEVMGYSAVNKKIENIGCCGERRKSHTAIISISGANKQGHPPKGAGHILKLAFDRGEATPYDSCSVINYARCTKPGDKIWIHSNKGQHRGPAAAIVFAAAVGVNWKEAVETVVNSSVKVYPDLSLLRGADQLLGTKMARYSSRMVQRRDGKKS